MLLVGLVGAAIAGDGREAERAVIGSLVAIGTEAAGTVTGGVVGIGLGNAISNGNGQVGLAGTVVGLGVGLAVGTTSSGAFAGVATRRSPWLLGAATTGVSLGGLAAGLLLQDVNGSPEYVLAGTLIGVPVVAGVGAALLPEDRSRRSSVSISPTPGGLRVSGTF